MRRRTLGTVLLLLLGGLTAHSSASPATPQPWTPTLPAPTYRSVSEYLTITMDDGIRLGATITFPSKDGTTRARGRFPVVLSMTPYGRDGVCGCPDQTTYPTRGIASAVIDVRGTGGSEGDLNENYFSPREARDGYNVVEWLGTRAWSTGKVGMLGGSYVGITQYLVAELRPPHLAAIAPEVALSDIYRQAVTYDGVPDLFFTSQYNAVQGGPGLISGNAGFGGAGGAGNDTDLTHGPDQVWTTLGAKAGQAQGRPIALDYLARPYDDSWYHARSPYYRASRIQVPVFIVDGWRDAAFVRGALEMYGVLAKRKGVETRIDLFACTHKGCGAPFDPMHAGDGYDNFPALEFDFLSHYLRGTHEHPMPAVSLRMQPSGPYLSSPKWPLPGTRFTRYYLHPSRTPALPSGDLGAGSLDQVRPGATGSGSYATDPAAGLSMALNSYGTVAATPFVPLDQTLETGHGLLWRTAPVSRRQRLVGPIQLHLVASSTATDTDWVARLSDVAPDGTVSVITEGALRASHRALDATRSSVGSPYHQ
ncbi:MAG: CocE/NonD family hydrolase, partial [Actinomycetota bacterium]|nr:CocE/NonD family hydrolase [Actinomycetota bacterium]